MTEFYTFILKMADEHWFLTFIAFICVGRFGNVLSFRRSVEIKNEYKEKEK